MNNIPRIGNKIANNNLKDNIQNASNNSTNNEEKEYSLKQFKKDYKHILRREVFPKLKPFEKERQTIYKLLLGLGIPTVVILTIFIWIFCQKIDDFRLIAAPIAIYIGLWHFLKKKLENKIKSNMMPVLMNAIPNFTWSLEPAISQTELTQTDIIPNLKNADYKCDDNFIGKYRDVDVIISEQEYNIGSGKNRRKIYQGAVIKIHMNKNFDGITLIRPKGKKKTQHKLEEVKLEDVEFCKKFQVYSDNQIEARYLITTSFMERFQNIKTAYCASEIYGVFYDKYIYIAPNCNKDLFSLAHLSKTLIDEEQYDILFDEFASILALVDHFKLDKKLGL